MFHQLSIIIIAALKGKRVGWPLTLILYWGGVHVQPATLLDRAAQMTSLPSNLGTSNTPRLLSGNPKHFIGGPNPSRAFLMLGAQPMQWRDLQRQR